MQTNLPFEDMLIQTYVYVDDFMRNFESWWNKKVIKDNKKRRNRKSRLSLSEIATIYICFAYSKKSNFKSYYEFLMRYHAKDFKYVSYERYITLIKAILKPLIYLLESIKGEAGCINFIDSTPMEVCKLSRKNRHKVFGSMAGLGRTSVNWFYGLKLHTIFNEKGEIVSLCITGGNKSDKSVVKKLCKNLKGKLYGDKGYISSKLFKYLFEQGTELITTIRKNMKNKLMNIYDKIALKHRKFIETIFSTLKGDRNFEHSRHRCPFNAITHVIGYLIAYQINPCKPQISINNVLKLNP